MAEIKNSFLSSKMNKDLDDRLIPNSQYRDALNISVGKSEQDQIGTVQNSLGNAPLNNFNQTPEDSTLICIGVFMDDQHNRIYQFLTNYEDPAPSKITLCQDVFPVPDEGWIMKITVYDYNATPSYKTIVSGTFLNFSTTNHVLGVSLVEGLLFFTDNRNQPRKINVNNAIQDPNYYYNETQISVAKYAPVEPISLFKKATATVVSGSGANYVVTPGVGTIVPGMTVLSGSILTGSNYAYVMSFDGTNLVLYQATTTALSAGAQLTFLTSTMTNKSSDPLWPGDPAFLEDKYVRFSYRFKFDDNEYSLFAPFTQIAYIPKQKGFFINGDETSAYKSTVIKWMENNINNIELLIPLPDLGSRVKDTYKIIQLDILYKESDSLAVKVLDSINYIDLQNKAANTNIYNYPYQSQKPYKTLPEDQLTRVYDNVPTRALGQEISGNRVIYGNFYNAYSAPEYINYNTAVQPKTDIFTNFIEYPNHTLKQNRNYQVGFILADKFGRQSSVILSTVDLTNRTIPGSEIKFGGSTVYAPYEIKDMAGMPDVHDWFGNALLVLVNNPIASTRDIPNGTPGIYATPTSSNGFSIITGATINGTWEADRYAYTFALNTAAGIINTLPKIGDYLRGQYTDYTKVVDVTGPFSGLYVVYTDQPISNLYLFDASLGDTPNTKFVYTLNEIGWYSYRVVVKQQQQDYYNVYLPGMLDGYPSGQTFGSQVTYTGSTPLLENGINTTDFPVGEEGKTSHIVLINDNINKVPRDLVEVGPDQKLYRSSVQLFGKVSNTSRKTYILADEDYIITDPYATSFRYKLSDNPGVLYAVRVGDGLQSVEANTPIVTPPVPNSDAWMANTVVTSNTLVAYECFTHGITPIASALITIEAPHDTINAGDIFTYKVGSISYDGEVSFVPSSNVISLAAPTSVEIPAATNLSFTRPGYGIITFTPHNAIRKGTGLPNGNYIHYIATSAESTQYYPTRQPDTVTAIATATDYNFLNNGVTNVKGTAGLNFYQLQANPSIGRVSTINPIGVPSLDMIPFLGVYETRPVDSLLALFWETASTGYISDLNWDVLTGYDGPARFSDLGFKFFENQNPAGTNIGLDATGLPNSPFITDEFYIQNNTGFDLSPLSIPTIISVKDQTGSMIDYATSFELVHQDFSPPNAYRIKIKDNFVFGHYANFDSNFTFTINIEWGTVGNFSTLSFNGRLGNIVPTFKHNAPVYDRFITQDINPDIVIVEAVNGTHASTPYKKIDLYWDITSGNEMNYFSIDYATGQIGLINSSIPLGIYPLYVRVRDAVIPPVPGNPLNGSGAFQTLQSTVVVTITVGPKSVPDHLQYYNTGGIVSAPGGSCPASTGQGYAAVHVGVDNLVLDPVTHINNALPDLTATIQPPPPVPPAITSSKAFETYVNVQIANGATGPGGPDPATGLTQGALEWIVSCNGISSSNENRKGDTEFILYYRPIMASPNTNTWQPVLDENGVFFPASTEWGTGIGPINVTLPKSNGDGVFASRSTSFVTSTPGEYCLLLKQTYLVEQGTPDCSLPSPFTGSVIVKDANYQYITDGEPVTVPPFPSASIVPVAYNVGIKQEYNSSYYPSGIPYDIQNPKIGLAFSTTGTLFAATPGFPEVDANKLQLVAIDPQLVPGLYVTSSGFAFSNPCQITDINRNTNIITLSGYALATIPEGTVINFTTNTLRPGTVWASSNNGLHVTQFYTDEALTDAWVPPVANKFYVYQNRDLDYNVGPTVAGMSTITNKPYFCAKFDDNGGVISIPSPDSTVLTAWRKGTGPLTENYGRNLFQKTQTP
jgi:hypothetical protein